MALTLDATLAAAQDAASRHPLVEIVSRKATADIPFDGQLLHSLPASEREPATLMHSTGRLIVATCYNTGIRYSVTDTARQEFATVEIALGAVPSGLALCELTGGNVGMVYLDGTYSLRYRIVTVAGAAVGNGTIATYSSSGGASRAAVITLGANSYLTVYARDNRLYKRTSSNFTTWSAEALVSGDTLSTSLPRRNPFLLLQGATLWLYYDNVDSRDASSREIRNCYYQTSTDSGATWSAQTALTGYDTLSTIGRRPTAALLDATHLRVMYDQFAPVLTIRKEHEATFRPVYDAVNRAVYVHRHDAEWYKYDLDSGALLDSWTKATTPAFLTAGTLYEVSTKGENVFCSPSFLVNYAPDWFVSVLRPADDTITHYHFADSAGNGWVKNVSWTGGITLGTMRAMHVDETAQRLYICWLYQHSLVQDITIGYLDLTEPPPAEGGAYTLHIVVHEVGTTPYAAASGHLRVIPEDDLIILAGAGTSGYVRVWMLSTGALYKYYTTATHDLPHNGIAHVGYADGCVYGSITYSSVAGHQDQRGMVRIQLSTDGISYHRPSWATLDDYNITDIIPGKAGQLICCCNGYGVTIFDAASDTWTLYNNSNTPGLLGADNFVTFAAYDDTEDLIFPYGTYWVGTQVFSPAGAFSSARYLAGSYGAGSWTFAASAPLVQRLTDYAAVAAVPPAGGDVSCYTVWERLDLVSGTTTVQWDMESAGFDLSPYLLRGQEVSVQRSIDGTPASLEFAVSHGHLFDRHNIASLWSGVLRKGRKLELRWGERVSGSDYWEAGGVFYVETARTAYARGVYSAVTVSARDHRAFWAEQAMEASDYYTDYPEAIVADLLQTHAGIAAGDIALGTWTGRTVLDHQFVDMTLAEMVEQIGNRYGCLVTMGQDGTVVARRIADDGITDHTYGDTAAIISMEPDDSYSDLTNRVTVVGTERSYQQVSYPEERVGSVNGTCGWYGYRNQFVVRYSEDNSRTCVNPRLVVVESATGIAFELAGDISESITYVDPDDHYCIVTVEAPDLRPQLAAFLTLIVTSYFLPDIVTPAGVTVPVGSYIRTFAIYACLIIISAVGNFQYEIHATPTGRIRRTVQATSDDEAAQAELGSVFPKRLEDPLCYGVAECQFVADHELFVASAQRRRLKLSKLAHLQDEEGDIIAIPHPYSGVPLRVFVTNLTRRLKIPEPGGSDGHFRDDIEGWVL